MLNRTQESRHPCLIPNLRGKCYSFSSFRIMLAVDVSYTSFIMLKYIPSLPNLLTVFFFFNHERLLNSVKYFFCNYWDHHMIFILYSTMWCVSQATVEPSLHLREKPHLIIVYDPFNVLLNSVCNILWRIFIVLCSSGMMACYFLFL